jgi:nucleoid DNA-binding protein
LCLFLKILIKSQKIIFMKVTNKDFVAHLVESRGFSKAAADRAHDTIMTYAFDQLTKGNEVELNGVGTLKLKKKAARKGATKALNGTVYNYDVAESVGTSFRVAKGLKEKLKGLPIEILDAPDNSETLQDETPGTDDDSVINSLEGQ